MRAWLIGGLVAVVTVGSAIAAFHRPLDEAEMTTASVDREYRTTRGAECAMTFEVGVVGTGDPLALRVAAEHIAADTFEGFTFPVDQLGPGETTVVTETVAARAAEAVRARFGPGVQVVMASEATCSPEPDLVITEKLDAEDFGREPSDLGALYDWVEYFRASTGHVCEVQIALMPAGDDDPRVIEAARAFLASVDLRALDYSDALRAEGAAPSSADMSWELREANAVMHTVVTLLFESLPSDPANPTQMGASSGARCTEQPRP